MTSSIVNAGKHASRRMLSASCGTAYRPYSSTSIVYEGRTHSSSYESPIKDFFQMIEEGRTSLGTTSDDRFDPTVRFLKCGVREDALRFKTNHFGRLQLTPYVQPGEHRVTLKVGFEAIPINDVERRILTEIVGNRVNTRTNELMLSSDQFGSRIENKRHLVTMLDRLVMSAKRLAKELEAEQLANERDDEEKR